jgi:carbon-monoxide dehydrogenase small subunit
MKLQLTLNGEARTLYVDPSATLVDVLRAIGLTGTKIGCREGHCGSCVVLLDGEPVNSCLLLAARADGRSITTIEAIGTPREPHPIQKAFVEAGAVQCGYCTPGMVLATKALLDRTPRPTRQQVLDALEGNLCRCTGYTKILDAVEAAADALSHKEAASR